ncbi:non-ribosomal peptide synthase, pvdD/pvdJ-like protein [Streptomyces laurentii]|uniref:Non-ribosomal peptide synthase, pvdD/pvdJ-like protein n=1 Tax=Streptomyces laurentii TaxID=39478 RepID=A0A160NYR5_STRLU|nr:non-ribosomal peptide synthase, pvdD/pvdJ-like protein [Streptomyces laurentii]
MALASRERQYLHQELTDEVNVTYASIVCEAWGMVLNSQRNSTPARQKTVKQTAAGMERAALIALKHADYVTEDMKPEERLKRDRKRYEAAWEADRADMDAPA